jgi:chorismate dehydratase
MLHGDQAGLFDLSFALPAECADQLKSGRTDIGIVPAIELTRQKLEIIPGAGIACRGPVRSILLISKVPFSEIQTLAADSSSRTSVMLARVILAKKYGVEPRVAARPPSLVAMLDDSDASLIIGDPALLLDPGSLPFHVLDLGAEWTVMTGLPMVFAVWGARAGLPVQDPRPFLDSLRFGMQSIDTIVDSEYAKRGISRQLAYDYLTHHIVFELKAREYEGLSLFLRYAGELEHQEDLRNVTV